MIDIGKEGTLWLSVDKLYYGEEIVGDFAELTLLKYPGSMFDLSAGDVCVLVNCLLNGNDMTYLDGESELEDRLKLWIEDIEEKIK